MTNFDSGETLADYVTAKYAELTDFIPSHKKDRSRLEKSLIENLSSLRQQVATSNRFLVEDDLVSTCFELSSKPNRLVRQVDWCKLPYEKCWIEFRLQPYFKAQEKLLKTYSESFEKPVFPDFDGRMGLLLCRVKDPTTDMINEDFWEIQFFILSDDDESPTLGFIKIRFSLLVKDRSWKFVRSTEHIKAVALTDKIFESMGWPSNEALNRLGSAKDAEFRINSWDMEMPEKFKMILNSHTQAYINPIWAAMHALGQVDQKRWKYLQQADDTIKQGLLPFVTTLLSTLNSIPMKTVRTRKEGMFRKGNTFKPFMTYNTISIDLPNKEYVQYIGPKLDKVLRSRNRRHEVRGFYRVYRKGTPDEFRIWIPEHERGDASLGWVKHQYELKKAG